MTERRTKRDWVTPILLTLSLHMLALTLFVNHRLFSMLQDPRLRSTALQVLQFDRNDSAIVESTTDGGAEATAPSPQKAESVPAIEDLVKASQAPLPALSVNRERVQKPDEEGPDDRGTANTQRQPGGGSHALRGVAQRGEALRRHGGSGETEDAVELGLAWLASVQDIDGCWDSDGYMVHYLPRATREEREAEGIGSSHNDIGVTGLSLLAFTGAGYGASTGRYADTIQRAARWLLDQQRVEDGGFGREGNFVRTNMYGHIIATLALCDLYLQTGDVELRDRLRRAYNYLLGVQNHSGGWDYSQLWPAFVAQRNRRQSELHKFSSILIYVHPSPPRNDLSITGWAVLALVAAREAGFGVPDKSLRRLKHYLDWATLKTGEGVYANKGVRAGARGLPMLAVSNVSRRLLGENAESPTQQLQLETLASNLPDWSKCGDVTDCNEYCWCYGSLALLLGRDAPGGDNRWREWNAALKKTLLGNQNRHGPRKGSFDPVGFWAVHGGGRLYMTALCVLSLEIYYRHEPQYVRARSSELAWLWE